MKTAIIRTNISDKVGLGHLFRMKNLAKELSKKNKVIFGSTVYLVDLKKKIHGSTTFLDHF